MFLTFLAFLLFDYQNIPEKCALLSFPFFAKTKIKGHEMSNDSDFNGLKFSPPKKFEGRIKKGEVRNPVGGRRKVYTAQELFEQRVKRDLRAAAKDFGAEALTLFVTIMRDDSVSAQHRLSAANSILDRGYGKPKNEDQITLNVYERMSPKELVKFITGKEIEGEVISSGDEVYEDEESGEGDEE